MYVRFVHIPWKICNNTQGKFSGSVNTDPVNAKYTSQQSTEEFLCKYLDGDFRSRKTID